MRDSSENAGRALSRTDVGRRSFLTIAFFLPAALVANFVWRFGVDVPYWDQWELVPPLQDLLGGRLTWAELFAQHNEHRILFPRLLMLGLARLTRWDIRTEMWASVVLLGAIALTLAREARRALGPASPWLLVPLPWLIFSLRQSENLLWGWQLQVPMAALGVVVALAALERGGGRWLWVGILGGVLASFSFAAGLGVWPAGLIVLLAETGGGSRRLRSASVWAGAAALVLVAYFRGWSRPAGHPSAGFVWEHLGLGTHFLVAMAGAGLAKGSDARGASTVGAVLLLLLAVSLACVARRPARLERARFGLGLLLFTGAFLVMATLGRAGFEAGRTGLQFALTSRYVTFSVLGIWGLYRVAISFDDPRLRGVLGAALLCLVALGTVRALPGEFRVGAALRRERKEMQRTLRAYTSASAPDLARLYPQPEVVRDRAPVLEQLGLSVFRSPAAPSDHRAGR